MNLKKAFTGNSFYRFIQVGMLNTAVGLGTTFCLLHLFQFSYWYAAFIGNGAGALCSYVLNRIYTFRSRSTLGTSVIRFIIVIFSCWFLSFYAGKETAALLQPLFPSVPDSFVKDAAVLISTGIYVILNYSGQKMVVFKGERNT